MTLPPITSQLRQLLLDRRLAEYEKDDAQLFINQVAQLPGVSSEALNQVGQAYHEALKEQRSGKIQTETAKNLLRQVKELEEQAKKIVKDQRVNSSARQGSAATTLSFKAPPMAQRITQHHDAQMNLKVTEHWLNRPSELVSGPQVLEYFREMLTHLQTGSHHPASYLDPTGPFNGLIVQTWDPKRPDCGQVKDLGGLTIYYGAKDSVKIIYVNGQHQSPDVYAHEQGHMYEFRIVRNDPTGQEFWKLYKQVRGKDLKGGVDDHERFANDFKYFFGPKGVARIDDLNDKPLVNGKVRKPQNVPGLKSFLQGAIPVSIHLRSIQYKQLQFKAGEFHWFNTQLQKWQRFGVDQKFYF